MRYNKLGITGLRVSQVGVGCNNFGDRLDEKGAVEVVHAALDRGVTLFDTADVYGQGRSEEFLGAALRRRRHEAVIATKFGMRMGRSALERGASRRYIRRAVEASLERLGTDHIDLYQMHFPDPDTPLEETLEALDDLIQAGKVLYIGCSNMSGWQIVDADWTARLRQLHRFASAQNAYSMLDRKVEAEVLPACAHLGLGFLPYFPLASGMLTGKYKRGEAYPDGSRLAKAPPWAKAFLADESFTKIERLGVFAAERGHDLLGLAFGWLLSRPAVTSVIAGAMTPEQVVANVAAAEWELSTEERDAADAVLSNVGD